MTTAPHSLLLIGCGQMGSALVRGWSALPDLKIQIVEPHDLPPDITPAVERHARALEDISETAHVPDIVLLAVKPQQMDSVLESLKPRIGPQTLVISIAAGRKIESLAHLLHPGQPLVRAMPNLPASIGAGITGVCSGTSVSPTQRELAAAVLSPAGKLVWIEDESALDAVTALSGSGPAYVFLLTEAMASAGEKLGLPPDTAMALARQTVIGSARLMESRPELPASTLRQNVTSPGGTTAAALDALMKNADLETLMDRALRAAEARARDLSR